VEDFRATALFALAVKGHFALTEFFLVPWDVATDFQCGVPVASFALEVVTEFTIFDG
jgi:hypothetical protein